MPTITLSSKGQLVLPKEIRDRLHWEAGAKIQVEEVPGGVTLVSGKRLPPLKVSEVAGMLRRPGMKPLSIREMDESIAREVRRRHARGRY